MTAKIFVPLIRERADLEDAGQPGCRRLDAVPADGAVGVVEHVDGAHRRERHPHVAVDRLGLLERGQGQHQLVALDPQFGHVALLGFLVVGRAGPGRSLAPPPQAGRPPGRIGRR
jgi:hypothetical protein